MPATNERPQTVAAASPPEDVPETGSPFWRYSLRFYRMPGVSEACLVLQDGCGADVNILLYLFWLAAKSRELSADEIARLNDSARSWRDVAVRPLRDIRRRLKEAATMVAPARQEALRTRLKAVELEAERLQQEALYEAAANGLPGKPAASAAAARTNASRYAAALGTTFPATALAALFDAFDQASAGTGPAA
jgi:uncharacterized protein (TIGR02444 family)